MLLQDMHRLQFSSLKKGRCQIKSRLLQFRACRCGPDSAVNPDVQLTYYDPGLGTVPEGSGFFGGLVRWVQNLVSQATGLGITTNIIDCYAEVIRMWEPGDRIFLFGFSRGAYTVRCLASVLSFCGVPTTMKDGSPLKRDSASFRAIAKDAVTNVYQHVSSPRDKKYADQRRALAARFQERHHSYQDGNSNAYPYFVGVFDTVASIASLPALLFVLAGGALLLAAVAGALWWFQPLVQLVYWQWLALTAGVFGAGLLAWYIENHLKFATNLPGFKWWQTIHFTAVRMRFMDNLLNTNVGYARHALAIDEHRKSFDRVKWGNTHDTWPHREKAIWFKQWWFAGNHSDIGGSYPENESRLSDIALQWMIEEAQSVMDPLITDSKVLMLYPSHKGMQHDETKGSVFRFASKLNREVIDEAYLHPSVLQRFEESAILQHDEMKAYRPAGLTKHYQVSAFYPAELVGEKTNLA